MSYKWTPQTNRYPTGPSFTNPPTRTDELRSLAADLVDEARDWLKEAEAFYGCTTADDEAWLRQRYAELNGARV